MRIRSKSLLRRLEYERLAQEHISGSILDVGGSKYSGYHELIQGNPTITVGNIDASYGVDMVFDAEKEWPFSHSSFDAVLCMNLLEHLYDYDAALAESIRVLKPQGRLVGVVPFMFNVHGSPSDYHRFTKHALKRHFEKHGYKEVLVEELGTGAFGVIYHCMLGFMRWNWLARACAALCTTIDRTLRLLFPQNKMGAAQYPLGYYFSARKP